MKNRDIFFFFFGNFCGSASLKTAKPHKKKEVEDHKHLSESKNILN